ncbi:MAG TPA: lyase family protein, partial [Anaerolineae bacterium]|nr:lyase family protein [Anaerolineae bacterium]
AALISATLAKIGTEIYNLQRPELGEVSEPFAMGRVGSITMPHKRNPEYSEQIVTLARVIRYNASLLTEGMLQEHERDGRSWKVEWLALPETCLSLGKALALTNEMIAGLVVHSDAMRRNLDSTQGYVLSEAVMVALAEKIGKQTAHQIVYEASMHGVEKNLSFKQALLTDERMTKYLTAHDIDALLDYRAHIGMIPQMIDRVLARANKERASESQNLYS